MPEIRFTKPSICPDCRAADLTEAQCVIGECYGQCSECDAVADSVGGPEIFEKVKRLMNIDNN